MFGGEVDKNTKFIAPTVVKDVGPNDSLIVSNPLLNIKWNLFYYFVIIIFEKQN